MKSFWLFSRRGGTTLEAQDVPVPAAAGSQLLVRMRAAGLNRGEFLARRDLHAAAQGRPAGNEGAGEVVAVGPEVIGITPGDRVMGVCGGAFSEFAVMEARTAILVPARLSWEEAACTPLVFLVVHDMLVAQGRLKPSDCVLVTGASSGVGVATIQAAKALGARTIGTSGSQSKLDRLKAAGLDVGLCTRAANFAQAVREATGGKGVNLAINNVGGSVFAECLRALAFEGRLATVGYVDGVVESTIDIAAVHSNRLTIFGVSALLRTPEQRAETVRGFTSDLLPFISDGRIKPMIDRSFDFADLPAAKDYMETNKHLGKIVVKIA
jgi:NADPH:quinone reductase-like Zn-dependent oxidoreductase